MRPATSLEPTQPAKTTIHYRKAQDGAPPMLLILRGGLREPLMPNEPREVIDTDEYQIILAERGKYTLQSRRFGAFVWIGCFPTRAAAVNYWRTLRGKLRDLIANIPKLPEA